MSRPRKNQPIPESAVALKQLRELSGLTQAQFAVALGLDPGTVSRCERGLSELTLTLWQVKKLCQLTKKRLEDLPDYLGKAPENGNQGEMIQIAS